MNSRPKWFLRRSRRSHSNHSPEALGADPLAVSGVLSADQLERAFQRERARVERNDQCFSLAVFRMPASKTTGTVRELLAKTAQVLVERVRSYDDVGIVDDCSLAVLLPETSGEGTWIFVDGALAELKLKGLTAACEVYTYPHPDSREQPRATEGTEGTGGGSFSEYGRVEPSVDPTASESAAESRHSQDGDEEGRDEEGRDSETEFDAEFDAETSLSSLSSLSSAQDDAFHQVCSALEQAPMAAGQIWRAEDRQAFGGVSLRSALSGTAVMERPAIRAVSGGSQRKATSRPHLRSVGTRAVGMSSGSSALAPVVTGTAPAERKAEHAVETRPIRDLAPYFEERLPFYRRAVDVLVAGSALAVLSPVLITGALLVKLTSPGPVIFAQPRAGRGGRPFQFYKLRSMYRDAEERKNALRLVNEKDGPIFKIKNDPRITPVGKVLRKFSIDELPQLFNVLKGDMTLVGPRPPVLDEVKEYETWQRQRLDITGGITCIWQVSGRSEVTFREWMRMDVRYRKQRSLGLDVKLIWKTFGAVFSGKGAY